MRAFCLYNSRGSAGWLDELAPDVRAGIDIQLGDIRDARFVEAATQDIEVVFHLAALIAIPYSYVAPESFIDTNVRGTLNALEAARRHGVRRFIQTSTSEVYGTPATLPITRGSPAPGPVPVRGVQGGRRPADPRLPRQLRRPGGHPAAVQHVWPAPVRASRPARRCCASSCPGPARSTSGASIRAATSRSSTDTVDGFVRAATTDGLEGTTIQLGTGRTESIGELFALACRLLGVEAEVVRGSGPPPSGRQRGHGPAVGSGSRPRPARLGGDDEPGGWPGGDRRVAASPASR